MSKEIFETGGSSKYLQLYTLLRKIPRLGCVRNKCSPTWCYYEEPAQSLLSHSHYLRSFLVTLPV